MPFRVEKLPMSGKMVQAWATLVALAGAGFKTDKQQQGNLAQQVNGKMFI